MSNELPPQHVHVGTGSLGLGLVAWLGSYAKLSVFLANRASSDSKSRNTLLRRTYQYELVFPDSQPEPVIFANLLFTDEDRDQFIRTVASPHTRLLTTALKGGFQDQLFLQTIVDAITTRIKSASQSPLYIIACENVINNSIVLRDKLVPLLPPHITQSDFEQSIVFVPCMVDRMCSDPIISKTGEVVQVEVERFAQLILRRPSPTMSWLEEVLSSPKAADYIEFVDDLEPYERRKLWLVNGPHLLIALNAFYQGYAHLHIYLQQEPLANEILTEILDEVTHIFLANENTFSLEELRIFNIKTKMRFRSHPYRVSQILSRFTESQRLKEFFTNFYQKVTEPTLQYMSQQGFAPFWTARTLFLVTGLIYEDHYVQK